MPGISDALSDDTVFKDIVEEIKRKVTGEVYDTEFTRILCKTHEELIWIKAWEDWAKERPDKTPITYADKLERLKLYIRDG